MGAGSPGPVQTSPTECAGAVFLVDDDAAVRRALARLLRGRGVSVSTFATAEEFLTTVSPLTAPACLVVDLFMPGLDGLALQQLMHEWGLDMPVVFISGWGDVGSGVQAMKGGAIDFLQKPVVASDLLAAVQRAFAEHRQRRVEHDELAWVRDRFHGLTPREREVFGLIVSGLLNKQIGAELGAAEKTIKVHRARVMQKMEAGSLAELVRMADRLSR
jgi:FixJ family two-component response regulator